MCPFHRTQEVPMSGEHRRDNVVWPAQFERRPGSSVPTRDRIDAGPTPDEPTLALGTFLEDWLRDVVRLSVRPKTYSSYESMVRIHLQPALGDIAVTKLRVADVQAYLNAKAESGLAPRTVAYHRNILRQALGHAERTELVARNVAKLARPPR